MNRQVEGAADYEGSFLLLRNSKKLNSVITVLVTSAFVVKMQLPAGWSEYRIGLCQPMI
jgi:hypothetical protein